jgi:hypothetical protein
MMANRSFLSVMQHFSGIRELLLKRGVNNLQAAVSRRIFYEYRCIDVRTSSIPSQPIFTKSPQELLQEADVVYRSPFVL